MSETSVDPADRRVSGLLRQLHRQHVAGATPHAGDWPSPLDVDTVTAALCLGGTDFAAWLVGLDHAELSPTDRYAVVLDAFLTVTTVAPDEELSVAQGLVDRFELSRHAGTLLDAVRAEFIITAGPLDEVSGAAMAAVRQGEWALALRGFTRLKTDLGAQVPREVLGMGAHCLHKLHRYAEAERWAMQGLGADAAWLAIGDVFTEAQLLQRWQGATAPVISIICTTFNHERYIECALRGFLSQDTEFAFEVLVHDDASTDQTQALVRRWQAAYPAIIKPVYQTENQFSQGIRPFETLLGRARGEFVAVCEGDDFWVDPGKLQRQVAFLKGHPEFSCSAHNYHHYVERDLTVQPWSRKRTDFTVSPRALMAVERLLWVPTLVFRKTFSVMPPERNDALLGDQFLTSYLGTLGRCHMFGSHFSAVRRENQFSSWTPLNEAQKERARVLTWKALVRMHQRLGNAEAATDLLARIAASPQRHAGETLPAAEPHDPKAVPAGEPT